MAWDKSLILADFGPEVITNWPTAGYDGSEGAYDRSEGAYDGLKDGLCEHEGPFLWGLLASSRDAQMGVFK